MAKVIKTAIVIEWAEELPEGVDSIPSNTEKEVLEGWYNDMADFFPSDVEWSLDMSYTIEDKD